MDRSVDHSNGMHLSDFIDAGASVLEFADDLNRLGHCSSTVTMCQCSVPWHPPRDGHRCLGLTLDEFLLAAVCLVWTRLTLRCGHFPHVSALSKWFSLSRHVYFVAFFASQHGESPLSTLSTDVALLLLFLR
jgi:hypothetical protein